MTKRPLTGPFSEDDGKMRLVGSSEMKVVIGNILSEDFVGGMFLDLKHVFKGGKT